MFPPSPCRPMLPQRAATLGFSQSLSKLSLLQSSVSAIKLIWLPLDPSLPLRPRSAPDEPLRAAGRAARDAFLRAHGCLVLLVAASCRFRRQQLTQRAAASAMAAQAPTPLPAMARALEGGADGGGSGGGLVGGGGDGGGGRDGGVGGGDGGGAQCTGKFISPVLPSRSASPPIAAMSQPPTHAPRSKGEVGALGVELRWAPGVAVDGVVDGARGEPLAAVPKRQLAWEQRILAANPTETRGEILCFEGHAATARNSRARTHKVNTRGDFRARKLIWPSWTRLFVPDDSPQLRKSGEGAGELGGRAVKVASWGGGSKVKEGEIEE
eukprot:2053972-Pleurochrysis_carterae.AAC.1